MTSTPFLDLPVIIQRRDTDGFVVERANGSNGRMSLDVLLAGLGVPGQAGSGMPTFSAGQLTYDGANHRITGDLTNFDEMPPLPSLIVMIVPGDVDRQTDALRVTLNLRDFALLDVLGNAVSANQLTPGCAHLVLRASTGYRLLDPLPVRPSDWVLRAAASDDQMLSEAQVAAGTAALVGRRTVILPADPTPDAPPPHGGSYAWLGVPVGVPDLTNIFLGGHAQFGGFTRHVPSVNDPNGVPYKWWRSNQVLSTIIFDNATYALTVAQGDTVYIP